MAPSTLFVTHPRKRSSSVSTSPVVAVTSTTTATMTTRGDDDLLDDDNNHNNNDDKDHSKTMMIRSSTHDNDEDDDNDDDEDAASSLSSFPLIQLQKKKKVSHNNKSTLITETSAMTTTTTTTTTTATATATATSKPKQETANENEHNTNDKEEEEEEPACCLCHCGIDCSDRALFFPNDRQRELQEQEGDYYFQMNDPYLPTSLYDHHNALVYCDSCNRLYHQKCHFVPLLVIPRGDWHCLICQLDPKNHKSKHKKGRNKQPQQKKSTTSMQKIQPWDAYYQNDNLVQRLYTAPPSLQPPTPADLQLVQSWEHATAIPKAKLWHVQLQQLASSLQSQASNIRMAQAALETLTSTQRNRAHFVQSMTQELAQTLLRHTKAQWNIRQALLSLEHIRTQPSSMPLADTILKWCDTHTQQAQHHVLPFGRQLFQQQRRVVPRTQEMMDSTKKNNDSPQQGGVPKEIVVGGENSNVTMPDPPSTDPQRTVAHDNNDDDNDSGISLDDLQCCICHVGDATDENDVLLCDGQGCYRAFHMQCVSPQVQPCDIENEDEDWFCPLCSAISNLVADLQIACRGEDWEHRHLEEHDEDDTSLRSWSNVQQDVFPNAEWEYITAQKLVKNNKHKDDDTRKLLAIYLGSHDDHDNNDNEMPVGSDSEDENDYSLFDQASFEERRRQEKNKNNESSDDDDDDSTASSHSSQATLVDMSSVELNIGKAELAALSSVEDDSLSSNDSSSSTDDDNDDNEDNDDDDNSSSGIGARRSSRRLRRSRHDDSNSRNIKKDHELGADFSKDNILPGKRRRKAVDYRKLNDALFGELSALEKAKLDDGDDFHVSATKTKNKKTKKKQSAKRKRRTSTTTTKQGRRTPKEEDSESDNHSKEEPEDVSEEEDEEQQSQQSSHSGGGGGDGNSSDDSEV